MAVARSSSDGVAIRYVLPVSWMTLCVQIISVNKLHEKSYTQSDATQDITDLTPRRVLKLTDQEQQQIGVGSLMSTITLFGQVAIILHRRRQ